MLRGKRGEKETERANDQLLCISARTNELPGREKEHEPEDVKVRPPLPHRALCLLTLREPPTPAANERETETERERERETGREASVHLATRLSLSLCVCLSDGGGGGGVAHSSTLNNLHGIDFLQHFPHSYFHLKWNNAHSLGKVGIMIQQKRFAGSSRSHPD